MKNDDLSVVENYESSELNNSVENKNASAIPMTEYDEQVSLLMKKAEAGWNCTVCPYPAKAKGHIREHVEEHIEGYSHEIVQIVVNVLT